MPDTLESYKYLGLDTVVERDHPQNNVNLTYIAQQGQPRPATLAINTRAWTASAAWSIRTG